MRQKFLTLTLFLILITFSSVKADTVYVTVENLTGVTASDLHLYFSGGGGVLYAAPLTVVAPGCPVPTVSSNPPVISSTVDIDWGVSCVMSGTSVSVLVTSPSGPLSLDSVCWSVGGPIVGCQTTGFSLSIMPPPGPFGAIKIRTRCVPKGPVFCTKWFPPGVIRPFCWARWCCIPNRQIYYRAYYCPFPSRIARFFETGPWIPLDSVWRKGGMKGPFYGWIFRTTPPPPDSIIQGPPPEIQQLARPPYAPWDEELRVVRTDDTGKTWQQGHDFIESFFDIFHQLVVTSDTTPALMTLSDHLQANAPCWDSARMEIAELRLEMQQLQLVSPIPQLPPMIGALNGIEIELNAMSLQGLGGNPAPPPTYFNMSNAFMGLSAQINSLAGLSPRFIHAAQDLGLIAQGFQVSGNAVAAGLLTQEQQDAFRWGLFNRFAQHSEKVATAMAPHARVLVSTPQLEWEPSTITGVMVVTQSDQSCPVDTSVHNLSSTSYFDVDLMPHMASSQMAVWFKVPGALAQYQVIAPADGQTLPTLPLVLGDIDDDNCVGLTDLMQVTADQGKGGLVADSVPSSDVDHNGIVDSLDLQIVQANFGQCGDSWTPLIPACSAPSCCVGPIVGNVDCDPAQSVDIADLTVLVDHLFISFAPLCCINEANIDGDLAVSIDIADLTVLVDHLFVSFTPLIPCP